MKYYGVQIIMKEATISLFGVAPQKVPMEFAEGAIGVIPVFKTKKAAKKWAGKTPLIEFESLEAQQ